MKIVLFVTVSTLAEYRRLIYGHRKLTPSELSIINASIEIPTIFLMWSSCEEQAHIMSAALFPTAAAYNIDQQGIISHTIIRYDF